MHPEHHQHRLVSAVGLATLYLRRVLSDPAARSANRAMENLASAKIVTIGFSANLDLLGFPI